jgi:hypothetical protein
MIHTPGALAKIQRKIDILSTVSAMIYFDAIFLYYVYNFLAMFYLIGYILYVCLEKTVMTSPIPCCKIDCRFS